MRLKDPSLLLFIFATVFRNINCIKPKQSTTEKLKSLGVVLTNSTKNSFYITNDELVTLKVQFTPVLPKFSKQTFDCMNSRLDISIQAQNYLNFLISSWIGIPPRNLTTIGTFSEINGNLIVPQTAREVNITAVYGIFNYLSAHKSHTQNLDSIRDSDSSTFVNFNAMCSLETNWNQFRFYFQSEENIEYLILKINKDALNTFKVNIVFPALAPSVDTPEYKSATWKTLDIKSSKFGYIKLDIASAFNNTMLEILKVNPEFSLDQPDSSPLKNFYFILSWNPDAPTERWTFSNVNIVRVVASDCIRFRMYEVYGFTERSIQRLNEEISDHLKGTFNHSQEPIHLLKADPNAKFSSFIAKRALPDHFRNSPPNRLTPTKTAPRALVETTKNYATISLEANSESHNPSESFDDEYSDSSSDEYSSYDLDQYLDPDEYSSYEMDQICRGEGCRKRRQIFVAGALLATTAIAGVAGAKLIHDIDTSKNIKHDEFLNNKALRITNDELNQLQLEIESEHKNLDKALIRECNSIDKISNQVFLGKIYDEFVNYRENLNQEISNLRTRVALRNANLLQSVINSCMALNSAKYEDACRDFFELTNIEVVQYSPQIDKNKVLSLVLEVKFRNPVFEKLSRTLDTLTCPVPIGRKEGKYYYLRLLTPKQIAYSSLVNRAFSTDNCLTDSVVKSNFCSESDLFNDRELDRCAGSLISNSETKACTNEIFSSTADCMFASNENYVICGHFNTPTSSSSRAKSLIPISKIGNSLLDNNTNITLYQRIDYLLTIKCASSEFQIRGKTREINEILNETFDAYDENSFQVQDHHVKGLLTGLDKSNMINGTNLIKIAEQFDSEAKTGLAVVDSALTKIKPYNHIILFSIFGIIAVAISILICKKSWQVLKQRFISCFPSCLRFRWTRTTNNQNRQNFNWDQRFEAIERIERELMNERELLRTQALNSRQMPTPNTISRNERNRQSRNSLITELRI